MTWCSCYPCLSRQSHFKGGEKASQDVDLKLEMSSKVSNAIQNVWKVSSPSAVPCSPMLIVVSPPSPPPVLKRTPDGLQSPRRKLRHYNPINLIPSDNAFRLDSELPGVIEEVKELDFKDDEGVKQVSNKYQFKGRMKDGD